MKDDLFRFLKGFMMGAANVIPGVSGGTIAFITGIYERLIEGLKRFDSTTAKLLTRFKWAEVWERVDGRFLTALGLGVVISILTLARVLEMGFKEHPILVWSFFFGLILASLPAVAKLVKTWTAGPVVALVIGCGAAVSLAFLSPASENTNPVYLVLCGVVAMCSMIIPGLSGSFVLLLMGNYQLIMIDSVNALSELKLGEALPVVIPVGIGAVVGLLVLARLLSWLFKNWHDVAVALIAGFIAGSLLVIWPWKDEVPARNDDGQILVKTEEREMVGREGTLAEVKESKGEEEELVLLGYENWHLPSFSEKSTWSALGVMIVGIVLILLLDRHAAKAGKAEKAPS